MSGIRTEDIHWLLEFDYTNEELIKVVDEFVTENNKDDEVWNQAKWNEYFSCGDYWTVNEICNHSRTNATYNHIVGGVTYEGHACEGVVDASFLSDIPDVATGTTMGEKVAVIAKYYQENVAAADVISLSVGNGNIGVFGFGRILEAIGFYGSTSYLNYNYEDLLRECDPALKADVVEMVEEIKVALAAYSPSSELTDVVLYIAVSLVLNYAGTLDAILQSNPDVEIILVPVMNTFGTETAEVEGITVGDLMEIVVNPINAYIAALPTAMQVAQNEVYADATFYWAEAGYVECMVDTYKYPLSGTIRDRFVESIVGDDGDGMIWDMLSGVVAITVDDINAYEQKTETEKLAWAADNAEKAKSIAMYIAFEKAIVNAAENAAVTLDSVLGLNNLDPSMFDGVLENYSKNIDDMQAANHVKNELGDFDEDAYIRPAAKFVDAALAVNPDPVLNVFKNSVSSVRSAVRYKGTAVKNMTETLVARSVPADVAAVQAQEIYDGVYDSYMTAYTLLATPDALSAALNSDTTVNALLALFARCVIGNGLGAHPSAEGHNALAKAVIEAYENKYTAADKTIENVVYLVSEYYDDAYAYGYAYALENGYVDAVVEAIDEAIAAVNGVELDTLGLTAELEAEVAAELAEVVEALEAAKALVLEADVLDEATLNALVAALEEANDALAQVNAVLAQAGADVNNLVILPAIEAAQEY
ncbi:MAG: hypothetical protein IIW63_06190, partial [Clostridia bacterium]|nr:hypothetical protein [Clostridia bacterium]